MHIRISHKEAKESRYWLVLTKPIDSQEKEKAWCIQECTEYIKIFTSIIRNHVTA